MFFMERKDKIVQDFAAAYSAVITEIGMNKTCSVFQIAVACHDKTYGLAAVEYSASSPDYSVYQFDSLSELYRFFLA